MEVWVSFFVKKKKKKVMFRLQYTYIHTFLKLAFPYTYSHHLLLKTFL